MALEVLAEKNAIGLALLFWIAGGWFFEEWVWSKFDGFHGLEVVEGSLCFFATDLSVEMEIKSMWAFCVDKVWLEGKEGAYGFREALHGSAEDVDTSGAA